MAEAQEETTQDQPVEDTPQDEPVDETTEDEPTEEEPTEDAEEEKQEESEPIDPEDYEIETRSIGDDDVEADYGEDIDPEDAKTIGNVAKKQIEPIKRRLQDQQDRLEVEEYLSSQPDEIKKYKPVILKYMKHPAYQKIPVKNIASMVASEDLMKMGAEKERQTQQKVNESKKNDNPTRQPTGSKQDWKKAPKEAFEQKMREVKGYRA